MVSAVLWDLDGTLVDTVELHVEAFLRALRDAGYDVRPDYADLYRAGIGKTFEDIVRSIMPDISEEELGRLRKLKQKHSLALIPLARPLPASRLLPRVPCPQALVSSSSRTFVEAILNHFGWRRFFDAIVTADDVERGKPAPDPVLLALHRLGAHSGVLIGDTDFDRICAEAAGIRFIHVRHVSSVDDILAAVEC